MDKANNEETVSNFILNVDTERPRRRAAWRRRLCSGQTASLKYKILDPAPNGGGGNARIRVKTMKGKTVKVIYADYKKVNVPLVAKFMCNLKIGTYKYFVDVGDLVGNYQPKTRSGIAHRQVGREWRWRYDSEATRTNRRGMLCSRAARSLDPIS